MDNYSKKILEYEKRGFRKIYHTYILGKKGYTSKEIESNPTLCSNLDKVPKGMVVADGNSRYFSKGEVVYYPADDYDILYNDDKGILSIVKSRVSIESKELKKEVGYNNLYYVTTNHKTRKHSIIINQDEFTEYNLVCEKKPTLATIYNVVHKDDLVPLWPIADELLYVGEFRGENGMFSDFSLDIFDYMSFASGDFETEYSNRCEAPALKITPTDELAMFKKLCEEDKISSEVKNKLLGIYNKSYTRKR